MTLWQILALDWYVDRKTEGLAREIAEEQAHEKAEAEKAEWVAQHMEPRWEHTEKPNLKADFPWIDSNAPPKPLNPAELKRKRRKVRNVFIFFAIACIGCFISGVIFFGLVFGVVAAIAFCALKIVKDPPPGRNDKIFEAS